MSSNEPCAPSSSTDAFDLIARHRQDAIIIIFEQQLLDLAAALRIDAFADNQRRRILMQWDRPHRRRDHRRIFDLAGFRFETSHSIDHFLQMFRRSTAATADDIDAQLRDELGQCLS